MVSRTMAATKTLAFEIGTEEIPAFDLKAATTQLEKLVPESLEALGLPFGEVEIFTTPRRLIAVVSDIAEETEAIEETFRGPSAKIAFDESGNPTKAAVGFARGKGLGVDALEVRDEGGTDYVFVTVSTPSKKAMDLLPGVLKSIIESLAWPKSMRWGSMHELFTRPIRWIVALLDDEIVPVEFANVRSDRFTHGHRFLAPGQHEVKDANELVSVVRSAFVVPSQDEREKIILEGVKKVEASTGCVAQLPAKTLTEVINLSEYPTVMLGSFNEEFLKVPEEIIVDAMLMHQRYFPLYDANGKLSNKFIIVSNGDPAHEDIIVDGNERVVAARLYDAKFFYDEDLKAPLESYVSRLDEVVFQEQLGTMREKTSRVSQLAERLAIDAGLEAALAGEVVRAATLAKADLVTNAVIEFTSVQGIMGSYYALASGESQRVANAIADHYRPRFSGDEPPADIVGRLVALADKIDTICGLFAVDQAPTGSSDPFALRRAALGVITMLVDDSKVDIKLVKSIEDSLRIYSEGGLSFNAGEVRDKVIDFFTTRTKVLMKDEGVSPDTIDAVLAVGVREPAEFVLRVRSLEKARKVSPDVFDDLATAYARANNLRDAEAGTDYDCELFTEPEKELAECIKATNADVAAALEAGDYPSALNHLASLRAPIDAFFDSTMIMDEDLGIRANRMKLLNRFIGVFANIADFGLMAKSK